MKTIPEILAEFFHETGDDENMTLYDLNDGLVCTDKHTDVLTIGAPKDGYEYELCGNEGGTLHIPPSRVINLSICKLVPVYN